MVACDVPNLQCARHGESPPRPPRSSRSGTRLVPPRAKAAADPALLAHWDSIRVASVQAEIVYVEK